MCCKQLIILFPPNLLCTAIFQVTLLLKIKPHLKHQHEVFAFQLDKLLWMFPTCFKPVATVKLRWLEGNVASIDILTFDMTFLLKKTFMNCLFTFLLYIYRIVYVLLHFIFNNTAVKVLTDGVITMTKCCLHQQSTS